MRCAGAQESGEVLLPGREQVVLRHGDALELVLKSENHKRLDLRAWLLAEGEDAGEGPSQGLVQATTSASRPGEWLVHLRGLKPPREGPQAWDLLLRWAGGEKRLAGAVHFRAAQPDVVLLLDSSMSMGRTDPQRRRVEAARAFLALGRRSGGIGRVALVQFDSKVRTLISLTPIGEALAFERALEEVREFGYTDINGGILKALEVLRDEGAASGAIVLLTDGKQEPGEYGGAHAQARAAGVPIHAVGLGGDADRALLRRIAAETGGTFADAGSDQDLLRLYASIAGRIAGGRTILRADVDGNGAAEFPVDGACRSLVAGVDSKAASSLVMAPPGEAEAVLDERGEPVYVRMDPPPGAWRARWTAPAAQATCFEAAAQSPLFPLFFRARPGADGAVEIDPDDPRVALSLAEAGDLLPDAAVELEFAFPDRAPWRVRPALQGGGVYGAALPRFEDLNPPDGASGTLRAVVTGRRANGEAYRRETEGRWTIRRSGVRALIAESELDLGEVWAGGAAEAVLPVSLRGRGGRLRVTTEGPRAGSGLADLSPYLQVVRAPQELASREDAEIVLRLVLPEGRAECAGGGTLILALEATRTQPELVRRVAWTAAVRRPWIVAQPAQLDLGDLQPGDMVRAEVKLAASGGQVTLRPPRERTSVLDAAADPRLRLLPRLRAARVPWTWDMPARAVLGEAPQTFALTFTVPADAQAAAMHIRMALRDALGRERGSLHANGRVEPLRLELAGNLDLGRVEPGDRVAREVAFWLSGAEIEKVADGEVRGWASSASAARAGWKNDPADPGAGRFELDVPRDAAPGAIAGWFELHAGPALARRRWTAEVVRPALTAKPEALDLGALYPGQVRSAEAQLSFDGAHATELRLEESADPVKPALAHIRLPGALLAELDAGELLPGESARLRASVAVPEGAQDGAYEGAARVVSRLSALRIPVRFRVVSPVPHPPFHVSPSTVKLRVEEGDTQETVELVVTSHEDASLTISARLEPAAGFTRAPAHVGSQAGEFAEKLVFLLPARGTARVFLTPWPDAQDNERCQVVLDSAVEKQAVDVGFQRAALPARPALAANREDSFFDWLRFLVFLLLVLLVLAIRALARKRWVRYVTYACAFHAVLMLAAVPTATIVGSLPPSVQLTLLTSQEEFGFELSPEQQRRLDALSTGGEPSESQAAPRAAGDQAALAAAESKLPEGQPEHAAEPAAAAELESARLHLEEPNDLPAAEPPAARAQTAEPREMEPALSAQAVEPLRQREPEPEQSIVREPALREIAEPLAAEAPAPAIRTPTAAAQEVPRASAPVRLERAATDLAEPVVRREETRSARPAREVPDARDAPLVSGALPADRHAPSAAAEAQPAARNAPVTAESMPEAGMEPALPAGQGETVSAAPSASARSGQAAPARGHAMGLGQVSSQTGSRDGRDARTEGPASDAADGKLTVGSPGRAASTSKIEGSNGKGHAPASPRDADEGIISGVGKGAGRLPNALGGQGTAGLAGKVGGAARLPAAQGAGMGRLGEIETENAGPGRAVSEVAGDAPLQTAGLVRRGAREGETGPPRRAGLEGGRENPAGSGLGALGAGQDGEGAELAKLIGAGGAQPAAPSPGKRAALPGGAHLDELAGEMRGQVGSKLAGTGSSGVRPEWGPAEGAVLRVRIGLAQHAGDWNSSPTAVHNLATAFRERCGLPDAEVKASNVSLRDARALAECKLLLLTSNDPVAFTDAERRALRSFVEGGGLLWINDSSASGDERFDRALREELRQIFPKAALERVEFEHPFFRSAYDLSRGYKGYRPPPGDKYRQDFIEGVALAPGKRLGVIYTRNDYADGLEIDPRNIAGRPSLTDLAPEEMLEGSLRFGINALAYALGSESPKFPPPSDAPAQASKLYRYHGAPLAVFDPFDANQDAAGEAIWQVAEWGNPGHCARIVLPEGPALRVTCKGGGKSKVAVARRVDLDLGEAKAVVLDLHSSMRHGFNVALLFMTGPNGDGYETRPVFVRPGWNRGLRYPLNLDDFKSSTSEWKNYNTPFRPRDKVRQITIMIYNLENDGTVVLDSLRIEK